MRSSFPQWAHRSDSRLEFAPSGWNTMKILITGICGFVGNTLARHLLEHDSRIQLIGFDNFIRPGSELNRAPLQKLGVKLIHADIRNQGDVTALPASDFVIDAAATPSVLGGVDQRCTSRQTVEHNLSGTINLLEYCKAHKAGLTLLSTSRVYSINALLDVPLKADGEVYKADVAANMIQGLSARGVSEEFSTRPPLSIYGSAKLASEILALEYGSAFDFPVYINRCGILAGAGQYGRPDQGIIAFWINSYLSRRPLKYIGFDGTGRQTRDCLHPRDLVPLLLRQFSAANSPRQERIVNCSGGAESAFSLRTLSDWCATQFGAHEIGAIAEPRPFDLPWVVLDSSKAAKVWNWKPATTREQIFDEIARHARAHPQWLEVSGAN
ncbi:MAG TPA: NAD-dependent epimerase/dehydratase family protein [Opitutaceae bacterium]|nr:NAD-dependent epimerase/dehydratase family protein [Opitutaceae bacterium]